MADSEIGVTRYSFTYVAGVGGPVIHILGPGLCTLFPVPCVRRILHKFKYWGLSTRDPEPKKVLKRCNVSNDLQEV